MASDPIARMDMSLDDIIKQRQAEAKTTKAKSSAPTNGKKVATTKATGKAVNAKSANAYPQARQKNQAPGGGKRALATAITAKVAARRQSTLAQKRGLKPAAQAVAKQRSQQLASASLVRTTRTPKRGFAVNKTANAQLQNNRQRQPQLQAKKRATPQQKPAKTAVTNPLAMRITVVNSPAPQARPPTSAAPAKAQRQPNQRQRNSGGISRNDIIMPGDALKARKFGKTNKTPAVSPVASQMQQRQQLQQKANRKNMLQEARGMLVKPQPGGRGRGGGTTLSDRFSSLGGGGGKGGRKGGKGGKGGRR